MQFEPLCHPIRLNASRYFYLPPPPTPGTRLLEKFPTLGPEGPTLFQGLPPPLTVTARIEPCNKKQMFILPHTEKIGDCNNQSICISQQIKYVACKDPF